MNQCLDSGIDKRRITVVANPVDISLFSPVTEKKAKEYRRETGIPEHWKPLICLIGAVTLRKGVDLLFEFFRLFQMKYPDAGLVIVGPSDNTAEEKQLTEKLMQFARDHSFSDKVLFTGQVSDVRPYLATSDFFVFTSRREGFANVVIESMAMGCPVIALKLPDITDTIIHHGRNGLIVDRADPELFVKAVENLMLDDDRREKMVAAALETVREKFSNEIIDRQYLDLYRRLQGIAVIETIQERN